MSVGELGSIGATAEAHRVSQPAVSMRLSTLERLLKIQLPGRATTGTRLTPAGLATVRKPQGTSKVAVRAAPLTAWRRALRSQVLPWPFFPVRVRGPDWRAAGHSPAQDTR